MPQTILVAARRVEFDTKTNAATRMVPASSFASTVCNFCSWTGVSNAAD